MKYFNHIRYRLPYLSKYLFVLAAFILAASPSLLSEGMFMDGLIYSSIAHNLSMGIGSFWHLSFSETVMRDFYGHPPLAIFIQSWVYTPFGDVYWIDKLYSFTLILMQALFIHLVWKEIWKLINPLSQTTSIWAIGFFLLSPLVIWASTNNLLENTLAIFVLCSIWLYLHAQRMKKSLKLVYLALSGMVLALGFLCKSFVGLFVWGLPLAWCISGCFRYKEGHAKTLYQYLFVSVKETILLIFFSLLPLGLVYVLVPQAQVYAHRYWIEQIVGSFYSQVELSRWYLLQRFIMEALPMLLVFVTVLFFKREKNNNKKEQKCVSILFLLLFIFGTLPLCVSLKQRTFYLLTAWPLLSLGFAVWMPKIKEANKRWNLPVAILCLLLAIGISIFFAVRPIRQTKLLKDVHVITQLVPQASILQISPKMTQEWSLYGYMSRYAQISLEHRTDRRCHFLLMNKNIDTSEDTSLLKDYEQLLVPLESYRLYRLKEINHKTIGF